MAALLVSWALSIKQGPLMVAATGSWWNLYMVKQFYRLLGVERCGQVVGVLDLVAGGVFATVAIGGGYYLATRCCRLPVRAAEKDAREDYDDEEKAPHGPQICEA